MTLDASHDLLAAMNDECVTWRMLRAHLPDVDLDVVDVSGLTGAQLAVVEAHLQARHRRQLLLHPVVPAQPPWVPTLPAG